MDEMNGKVKVKLIYEVPRHEDVWGSEGIDLCIVILGNRWR
jgi:hypothetical protein